MEGRLVNMEIQKTKSEMGGRSISGEYTPCTVVFLEYHFPTLSSGEQKPCIKHSFLLQGQSMPVGEQEDWWVWQPHDGTRSSSKMLELEVCPLCRRETRRTSSLNTFYVDKAELSAVWEQIGADREWLWSTDETTTKILFKQKTDCIYSLSC